MAGIGTRRTILGLFAAAVLASSIIVALTLHVRARERALPTESCRDLFIVLATFGDEPGRTLRLLLDTGAGATSITPEAIRRLIGRDVEDGSSVTLPDGRAGPLRIRSHGVRVHSMTHLSHALGREIDGILGFPEFRKVLLTLDYPASEVRVSGGRLPAPDGRTVFPDAGDWKPYLEVEVGDARVPVLLDSGFTGALDLPGTDGLHWEIPPRTVSASARFDRITLEAAGRLAEDLIIGPLRLERPLVNVSGGTRLVGASILRRFVLTFDQRSRRIRMVHDSNEPIRMPPMRGIGLAFRPTDAGLEVIRVLANTTAEAAGFLEGDVVVAVDGVPVYELGCVTAEEAYLRERIVLTALRDGEEQNREVEVMELVP